MGTLRQFLRFPTPTDLGFINLLLGSNIDEGQALSARIIRLSLLHHYVTDSHILQITVLHITLTNPGETHILRSEMVVRPRHFTHDGLVTNKEPQSYFCITVAMLMIKGRHDCELAIMIMTRVPT